MKEYQNIKIFLQKTVSSWSEKRFVIKKVKNSLSWHILLVNLTMKKLLGLFLKRYYKKQIKESSELKK